MFEVQGIFFMLSKNHLFLNWIPYPINMGAAQFVFSVTIYGRFIMNINFNFEIDAAVLITLFI